MKTASVLILECHRQTLPVAWALRDEGHAPTLGVRPHCKDDAFVGFSRVTDRIFFHSEWSDPRLVQELSGWLQQPGEPRAILPVGEASLAPLMSLRRRLPDLAPNILIPSDLCIERSLRKDLYGQWAAEMDLAQDLRLPRTLRVQGMASLIEAVDALGYPLALKPLQANYRLLGKKCVFVENERELDALPHDQIANIALVAQPRAGGRRRNLMFLASEGKVRALFECEVLRTDVLDGTGYGVDVISVEVHPDHRRAVESLVSGFDWDGLGCAQFMFDADTGASQFLEINPRIDANFALCYLSGVNLISQAVSDRINTRQSAQVPAKYPIGKRIHWAMGDLDGLIEQGLSPSQRLARAKSILGTMYRANGSAIFRAKDPLPALYLGYRWTGELIMAALKGLFSRKR